MVDIINTYYVYMYLDLDNIPFYVGKGKDYRYHVSCHLDESNPNCFLKSKIRKVGVRNVKIYFLYKNLTEEQAFKYERYYISVLGRRNKKEGTLCNLTDGGEGNSGRICSEETRQKISKIHKGKKIPFEVVERQVESLRKYYEDHPNPFKGKTHSEETCKQMSESATGRKLFDEAKRKLSEFNTGRLVGEKNPMYGKQHTEEAKQKIGEASRGRKMSEEAKQKMGESKRGQIPWNKGKSWSTGKPAWNKGKKMSEEFKRKMRKVAKDRKSPSTQGEQNPSAKLTEKEIKIIRRSHKNKTIPNAEICKRFNISQAALGHIIARRTWKHVE